MGCQTTYRNQPIPSMTLRGCVFVLLLLFCPHYKNTGYIFSIYDHEHWNGYRDIFLQTKTRQSLENIICVILNVYTRFLIEINLIKLLKEKTCKFMSFGWLQFGRNSLMTSVKCETSCESVVSRWKVLINALNSFHRIMEFLNTMQYFMQWVSWCASPFILNNRVNLLSFYTFTDSS